MGVWALRMEFDKNKMDRMIRVFIVYKIKGFFGKIDWL
jgi:hypothetical protein